MHHINYWIRIFTRVPLTQTNVKILPRQSSYAQPLRHKWYNMHRLPVLLFDTVQYSLGNYSDFASVYAYFLAVKLFHTSSKITRITLILYCYNTFNTPQCQSFDTPTYHRRLLRGLYTSHNIQRPPSTLARPFLYVITCTWAVGKQFFVVRDRPTIFFINKVNTQIFTHLIFLNKWMHKFFQQ